MMRQIGLLLILLLLLTLPAAAQEEQAGDTRLDDKGIEQVWVPAGCFTMGTEDAELERLLALEPPGWMQQAFSSEQPAHEVCLTEGFWIDKYEVTNAAWQAFAADGGYENEDYWSEAGLKWLHRQRGSLPKACFDEEPNDHPRACITWYEAEAYAQWRGGTLPTEAQWEYAARGPESLIYPWGNEWDDTKANVIDSQAPTPVGSYPEGASWVEALDMAGNLMEWTQDWLDPEYYQQGLKDDPTGAEEGDIKAERGGWWGSNLFAARSAYRHFEDRPNYQDHHIGVRIVSAGE